MSGNSYSVSLCECIVLNQQRDLFVIFEMFSDKVSDPQTNIFFKQGDVLEIVLNNIKDHNKSHISLNQLFKGLDESDLLIVESLDLENKIIHNCKYSAMLGIDYFDEKTFLNVLDRELENIANKYNLKCNDDYNKLSMFLSSIKLNLQSSDDALVALVNLYAFYKQHSRESNKKDKSEYISIYGNKRYKIDILEEIIRMYSDEINSSKIQKAKKNKKTNRSNK